MAEASELCSQVSPTDGTNSESLKVIMKRGIRRSSRKRVGEKWVDRLLENLSKDRARKLADNVTSLHPDVLGHPRQNSLSRKSPPK